MEGIFITQKLPIYIIYKRLIHFQSTERFLILLKKKNSKIRDRENNTEKITFIKNINSKKN